MDTKFLDEFSQEVWSTTYKNHADNNIDDTLKRVAKAVASVEKTPELQEKWFNNFYELLTDFKLTSGGRILANAGTDWKGTTLMNCFVGPKPTYDQDSLEGIIQTLLFQAQTLKSEGGWGMNFSFIRPRGSFIYGIGVETPGAVKYMELFDKSSDVITAGSGLKKKNNNGKTKIRKGAMMGVLDVWHPDIEEFITAKLQENRLSKFNISVNCSNEFMDKVSKALELKKKVDKLPSPQSVSNNSNAVQHCSDLIKQLEEAEKWDLVFPDTKHPAHKTEWNGNISEWKAKGYPVKIYKTVKATDLWAKIMHSTYTRNDPGVLFLDRANETHCWNYGGPEAYIAATNPCGEQCLPFGAVCNLASLNITQFVDNELINWEKLRKYVPWAVRFLDNVNDLTNAPLPQYAESIKKRRRIGLGVMGWGSALYLLKLKYGSDNAEMQKKMLMEEITTLAIETSIDLAVEKGMFEGCDPQKHSWSEFFRQIQLPQHLRDRIAKHGIRNSALFSIQPTGNTSVLANVVSGGLEPVFLHEYIRTVIVSDRPAKLDAFCPKYWEGEFKETELFKFAKEGDETILRGVYEGIVYKIDKNRGLTKEVPCVDYAVRILRERGEWNPKADWAVTTANLKVEDHITDMVGFAKWIDSSMSKTVNLPNNYSVEEFNDLYLRAYKTGVLKGITTYRDGTMTNVLASKKTELPKTNAPKRPNDLKAELHHFSVGDKEFYSAVGLYGDSHEPYEIFTGLNKNRKQVFIPKKVHQGIIRKIARGKYIFVDDNQDTYELTNGHSDDTASALSRVISASLRHGCDLKFLVEQLLKTEGPMVSFSKVLARSLKKYIKEGESSTEDCPTCNTKLKFSEGCKSCTNCGYSKCS